MESFARGIHSGNLRGAFLGQDSDRKNRDDRSLLEKYCVSPKGTLDEGGGDLSRMAR